MTPAGARLAAHALVDAAVIEIAVDNDLTAGAYMIMRAAALRIRDCRGPVKAAEAVYALADEIATAEVGT